MGEFLKTDLDDNEQSQEHTYTYTSIEHHFNGDFDSHAWQNETDDRMIVDSIIYLQWV